MDDAAERDRSGGCFSGGSKETGPTRSTRWTTKSAIVMARESQDGMGIKELILQKQRAHMFYTYSMLQQ